MIRTVIETDISGIKTDNFSETSWILILNLIE